MRRRRAQGVTAERLKDLAWEVAERHAFYRELLDRQDDIIWCENSSGAVVYANPAFLQAFGALRQTDAKLARPASRASSMLTASAPTSSASDDAGRVVRMLEEYETNQGWRWFEVARQTVEGHRDGACLQCVGRDVTERIEHQHQLEEARDAANAANRAKSRFLAAMSHEIRTPMNGILGMATLLADTPLEPEQRSYVSAMDQSGRTLMALIDEILDFSKIEAGRLDLADQPIIIDDCIHSVVELLAPKAFEKGVALSWAIDPTVPAQILGDENRLRQILTNLIGNAIKFTDAGGVLVTIEGDRRRGVRGDRSKAGVTTLIISVLDTGIGISRDALDRLFAEFERGDAEQTRRHAGTGLGLAITRRLARAMGGDVFARSRPGEGSTFTALLQLKTAREVVAVLPDHHRDSGAELPHVLLALRPGVELLASQLTLQGAGIPSADVTSCEAQVREIVQRAVQEDAAFTALVVDVVGDGSSAADMLRNARSVQTGHVRGIALLDADQRSLMGSLTSAGFDAFLARPLRPRALLDALRVTAAASPTLRALPGGGLALLDPRPMTNPADRLAVLLVEDNAINALMARRMLEIYGCAVTTAANGLLAVQALDQSLHSQVSYDLVLMDVHMPVMDGLEAARTIRDRFVGTGQDALCPPIVALTANAFEEDRQRCLAAGMSDYLAKPFDREALHALLNRIEQRKAAA